MRFTINKTSTKDRPNYGSMLPCEGSRWEHVKDFHGNMRLMPTIYLASLEELVKVAIDNGGRVVVDVDAERGGLPHIEIYDDWRE